jgi:multicomponent Na+:H+ antiporter subunit G
MTIREWVVFTVAGIGVLIMLLSSIGVWRLPDVFTRMHAFGKAATMGISCLIIAAGIYYPEYLARMLVLVVLFFITGPIAGTAMARAAYRVATPDVKFALTYDEMGRDAPRAEVQQE